MKKGQQLLFNLIKMKKFGCQLKPPQTVTDAQLRESSRAGSPPGSATAPPCNRRTPQRVVWSAQRITRGKLPALQDTNSTRCHRKVIKIIKDYHPCHCLFTVYHSAIQFVTEALYTTHHCDLYALVAWPSLHIHHQTHWLQVIYKPLLGKAPPLSQLAGHHSSTHL